MRRSAYWMLLLYICVVLGVAIELPGALGSAIRLSQIGALTSWGLSLVVVTRKIRKFHPLHVLFGLFLMWSLTTYLWSMDPKETLQHFSRSVMMFLMSVAVWDLCRTSRQKDGLQQAIVIAGYILVGICLMNFRSGAGKDTDASRFSAGVLDPNDMGLILAVIIPIAWHVFLNQLNHRGALKYVNMAYPVVALIGITLAGSRGSLVAALPGLIYIVLSFKHLPSRMRMAIPILLVAGLAFAVKAGVSSDPGISKGIERLASVTGSASEDKMSGRTEIWAAGWDVFLHHPFVGVGSGAFPESTRRYPIPRQPTTGEPYVAHNTYLSIVTETGIVGFALFAAAVFAAVRTIWAMGAAQRWGWLVSIASLMIGVSSLSWDFRPYIWIFLTAGIVVARPLEEGFALALPALSNRRRLSNHRLQPVNTEPEFQL